MRGYVTRKRAFLSSPLKSTSLLRPALISVSYSPSESLDTSRLPMLKKAQALSRLRLLFEPIKESSFLQFSDEETDIDEDFVTECVSSVPPLPQTLSFSSAEYIALHDKDEGWSCGNCTLRNSSFVENCQICNSLKRTSILAHDIGINNHAVKKRRISINAEEEENVLVDTPEKSLHVPSKTLSTLNKLRRKSDEKIDTIEILSDSGISEREDCSDEEEEEEEGEWLEEKDDAAMDSHEEWRNLVHQSSKLLSHNSSSSSTFHPTVAGRQLDVIDLTEREVDGAEMRRRSSLLSSTPADDISDFEEKEDWGHGLNSKKKSRLTFDDECFKETFMYRHPNILAL